jgi:hypothetical protein
MAAVATAKAQPGGKNRRGRRDAATPTKRRQPRCRGKDASRRTEGPCGTRHGSGQQHIPAARLGPDLTRSCGESRRGRRVLEECAHTRGSGRGPAPTRRQWGKGGKGRSRQIVRVRDRVARQRDATSQATAKSGPANALSKTRARRARARRGSSADVVTAAKAQITNSSADCDTSACY